HTLYFRRLIGADFPPLDARIRATTRRNTQHQRGKIPGAETDHRTIRDERGHTALPYLAVRHRIAGAGPHDLDDGGFVHDHTFTDFTLISNHAQFGSRIALQYGDATTAEFIAQ